MAKLIKQKTSPYWYARFWVDGKEHWVSTKKTKKSEAQEVAETLRQQARGKTSLDDHFDALLERLAQVPPADQAQKRRQYARRLMSGQASTLKIKDAWQAWLDSPLKGNPGDSTIGNYGAIWRQFVEWITPQGIEYVHEVTPLHADKYSAHLWKSKVAPRTFNGHVKFLRSMFRILEDVAGLVTNPWTKIRSLDKETQSRENFTPAELATICAKATGSFRYMIGIGLYTGMRLGDVVNLRWKDIQKDKIVIIPQKTRRKGKKLTLPVHPILAALLHELRQTRNSDDLFPEDRAGYLKDSGFVTKRFQQFLEDCGIHTTERTTEHRQRAIVRKGFHSLRHSFVSLCAANRVPQVAIQDLVGHGSPAMTELYSHADFDQKQSAIAALPALDFHSSAEKPRIV